MTQGYLELISEPEKSSKPLRAPKDSVVDLIIEVEEKLSKSLYERFTEGTISRNQLAEAFQAIRDWSHCTQELVLKWGFD
jgi:hypothetical protein